MPTKRMKVVKDNTGIFQEMERYDGELPDNANLARINEAVAEYGLHMYHRTSALTGEGVKELFSSVLSSIPWQKLPRTQTPKLFQVIREFLLEQRAAGQTLVSIGELHRAARERYPEREAC